MLMRRVLGYLYIYKGFKQWAAEYFNIVKVVFFGFFVYFLTCERNIEKVYGGSKITVVRLGFEVPWVKKKKVIFEWRPSVEDAVLYSRKGEPMLIKFDVGIFLRFY